MVECARRKVPFERRLMHRESPKYRAQMLVYLAKEYSQARYHEKAAEHAMAALKLDPTMEEAREIIDDE